MKKRVMVLGCAVCLLSGITVRGSVPAGNTPMRAEVVTSSQGSMLQDKSLNDIRFAGWTQKEWLDNDYIRAVRKYLDAYNKGEVKDNRLDEFKADIQGQFVIGNITPYIMGGALIKIIFVDKPDKIFSAWVYSEVNEDKKTVSNYECRSILPDKAKSNFTKETILQAVKERPELKLW